MQCGEYDCWALENTILTVISARILASVPFTAVAFGATLAPRIELYTELVCATLKPDVILSSTISNLNSRCTSDPEVQAGVAKLSTSMCFL